ncbi:sugar ABC transporter ATP-binding protein [Risungbinella massiliensis]|uniref:sugar ABC transporter ATP-binding protein n=1 Tax=Risungbinella massiliensis TaxID=1329796 RepID=UPI0005CB8776|nr:sugar ABC transporter ATP-binding protein [Risungbinella massiliensis]
MNLTMTQIEKSYASHQVVKKVDFSVKPGEVHALIGVNGAGKSTLMKILSGQVKQDVGEMHMGEHILQLSSPAQAIQEGIGIVVQEVDTALIPELSVVENLTLDELLRGSALVSWKKRKQRAKELLQEVGIEIPVDKLISSCTLAEKQMILIARTIASDVKFLILDEPTAPLSERETNILFSVIRRLQEKGVGIIYISHRLPEVKEISDRITVLRDGQVVTVQKTKEVTTDELIRYMLGKTISAISIKENKPIGKPLLELNQFYVAKTGQALSFTLYKGEVLGIAGLVGAGKTETARALFGRDKSSKNIIVKGREISLTSPQKAIQAGITLVPEERRKEGLLVDFPLTHNLSLPSLKRFTRWGWLKKRSENQFAEQLVNRLRVKTPSLTHSLRQLSGGNQQKVSIGKWLETNADLFLLDEPTKGIDIGAKEDVFSLIRSLAEQGKGILYFTSEFSELLTLADRILVMVDGMIVRELFRREATLEKIMQAATGGYHGSNTQSI